jgi:hypothetical protein
MTITPLLIYGISTLNVIGICLSGIGLCILLSSFISQLKDEDDHCNLLFIGTILILISIFIPSKKTMYEMLIVPTVVNSPTVQKLPDELQAYINKTLEIKKDLKK